LEDDCYGGNEDEFGVSFEGVNFISQRFINNPLNFFLIRFKEQNPIKIPFSIVTDFNIDYIKYNMEV
jgi:hypothetical protein